MMELGKIRLLILWLRWKILRQPAIVLIDFDGAPHARACHGYGEWRWSKRLGFGIAKVRLMPDGTAIGVSYVKKWKPLFPPTFKIMA